MIYDKKHENLSKKVAAALYGICPALEKEDKNGHREWHKWKCTISGGTCSCIWHVKDFCRAGRWKHLAFAKDYNDRRQSKVTSMENKVKMAMDQIDGKYSKIESRSSILDLDNGI